MDQDIYANTIKNFEQELDILGEKMSRDERQKIKNYYRRVLPKTTEYKKLISEIHKYMNGDKKGFENLYKRFLNNLLKSLEIKGIKDPKYDDFETKYGFSDDDFVNLMVDTYYKYLGSVLELYE